MTDQTMTTDAIGPTIDQTTSAPPIDPQARARELAILDALRSVVDPEIGMNVVELALIRQVVLGDELTEVRMVMTTPFCPYAGSLMQQVKEAAEEVEEHDVGHPLVDDLQRRPAVAGGLDLVVARAQVDRQGAPHGGVVVHDEHEGHGVSSSVRVRAVRA